MQRTTKVFAIAGREVVSIGFGSLLCRISWLDVIYFAVEHILYISFLISICCRRTELGSPCHRKYSTLCAIKQTLLMCKILLTTFLIAFISCSTSKKAAYIYNANDIDRLVSLAAIIKTQHPKTECGLKTFRIANTDLKDSLNRRNIFSLSIKYFHDTINANEYFYGNSIQLPDSCIIFSKDDYRANENRVASTLLFYFFGKVKPTDFHFSTYEPIREKTKKINDSTWIYKSVHELIVIH